MARIDGYWAGYREYRYGSTKKAKPKRVFTGEERKHVVQTAMDLMQDWRCTPFENEGAFRHGFRSALCIEGYSWDAADNEAALVINEVFTRSGIPRPSWDEGQRQYAVAEENCNWCAVEIPEDDRIGSRKARFCSSVCARSALTYRDWESRWKESAVGRSAFAILHRESKPMRRCEFCGTDYHPFNGDTRNQRYCTHECARLALRTIPECDCPTCGVRHRPRVSGRKFCSYECAMARPIEPRECECCGKSFTPKNEQGTICSQSCRMRLHRIRKAVNNGSTYKPLGIAFDGTCRHCHQPFMARSPKAIYCGSRCNSAAYKARRRVGNVIYLTAEIFDGWFRRAA